MRRSSLALGVAFALASAPAAALTLQAGHILALSPANPGGGWISPRTLVQIDPVTGATSGTLVLTRPAALTNAQVTDVVVLDDGHLLVTALDFGYNFRAFRVDPLTGTNGPLISLPSFGAITLAREAGGTIVTAVGDAPDRVIRFDATASSSATVGSLINSSAPVGPPVAVGPDGTIYTVDFDADAVSFAIASVDPVTGAEQIVSSGGLIALPLFLAVGLDGTVYVADEQLGGGSPDDVILAIDPTTGAQSVLAAGFLAGPLEMEADGNLLIRLGDGTLRRVDPDTGAMQLLASGLAGAALAVVPASEPAAALLFAGGVALTLGARRGRQAGRDRSRGERPTVGS